MVKWNFIVTIKKAANVYTFVAFFDSVELVFVPKFLNNLNSRISGKDEWSEENDREQELDERVRKWSL